MIVTFRFEHDGKRFQVVGQYGTGANEGFSVATLVDSAKRVLCAASSDVPRGVKLESLITAASQAELVLKLQTCYPGMKNFSEVPQ